MSAHRSYSFGEYTLDLTRGALLKAGADVKLRPKSFEVLRVLVERHGQLVTKDELLSAIWGHIVVTEASVTQCLVDVRRAIGDKRQRIIRTVPRRGFIFDVPVVESDGTVQVDDPQFQPSASPHPRDPVRMSRGALLAAAVAVVAAAAIWWGSTTRTVDGDAPLRASAALAPPNSIAVLPFVNMSPEQDQEYFSDGISEEILNLLAQSPELQVIARTSSFSFKGQNASVSDIAAKLNVAYVLEGSVRKSGPRVRITAQLVDAANSSHLWSEVYDREVQDSFAVQSEIATRVANALKVTLASVRIARVDTTPSADAHEHFLRARFFHHRRGPGDVERARHYYEEALLIDPRYARAWAGLAGVYGVQISEGEIPVTVGLEKRRKAVEQALALGPNLAEAHIRAAQHYWDTGDGQRAAAHATRAYALDRDDPLVLAHFSNVLAWQDRIDDAAELQRRIVHLDPVSLIGRVNFANTLLAAGRLDEAEAEFLKTIEINPQSRSAVEVDLGRILILRRQFAEALERIERWPSGEDRDQGLALVNHALGRDAEADAAIRRLIQGTGAGGAVRLAEVYAYRGNLDESFKWMATAHERLGRNAWISAEWEWVYPLRFSPFLKPLRADPRWSQVSTLGLPPGTHDVLEALPEQLTDAGSAYDRPP